MIESGQRIKGVLVEALLDTGPEVLGDLTVVDSFGQGSEVVEF